MVEEIEGFEELDELICWSLSPWIVFSSETWSGDRRWVLEEGSVFDLTSPLDLSRQAMPPVPCLDGHHKYQRYLCGAAPTSSVLPLLTGSICSSLCPFHENVIWKVKRSQSA